MHDQPIEVFERQGRVKGYDARKGLGFIEAKGPAWEVAGLEGADIMLHYSVIQGPGYRVLRDGQAVRFDAVFGDKGWKATRVVPAAEGDAGEAGIGAVPKRPPGLL